MNFISSFLISMTFFFPCLIALARPSNMMTENSGEWDHHCIVPDLSRKTSGFSPLSMMLANEIL